MGAGRGCSSTSPRAAHQREVGAPGCWLRSSLELVAPLPGTVAVRALPLVVPADPQLLGLEVHAQALAADPAANALGLVVSNGGLVRLGGR